MSAAAEQPSTPPLPVCHFGFGPAPCFFGVQGGTSLRDCELTVGRRRPDRFELPVSGNQHRLGHKQSIPTAAAEAAEAAAQAYVDVQSPSVDALSSKGSANEHAARSPIAQSPAAIVRPIPKVPQQKPKTPGAISQERSKEPSRSKTPETHKPLKRLPLRPRSDSRRGSSTGNPPPPIGSMPRNERRKRKKRWSLDQGLFSGCRSATCASASLVDLPRARSASLGSPVLQTPLGDLLPGSGSAMLGRKGSMSFKQDDNLTAAIREGRWIEAYRRWTCLEASHTSARPFLEDDTISQLRRVSSRFEESVEREIKPAAGEQWQGQGDGFAYRLANDFLQVMSSKIYRGTHPLLAFVALCEYDLFAQHTPGVISATPVGQSSRACDSTWHVLRTTSGRKEDNLLQVSCVDALDEPLDALWVSTYVPWELEDAESSSGGGRRPSDWGRTELQGATLPKPQEGKVRLDYWRSVYAIKPMWLDFGTEPVFQLTMGIRKRPSSAACVFPSFMQSEVATFWKAFDKYLDDCKREIGWRMCFSRNVGLYDSVRRRLAERVPDVLSGPSLLEFSFLHLSDQFPEDWADSADPAS